MSAKYEIRPQESAVKELLESFNFDETEIKNFLNDFFLSEIAVEQKSWHLKFYYTEIDLNLNFTQKLEYYFKLKFPDYLDCDFKKIEKRRNFEGRKAIRESDGEVWDKNLRPSFPIPHTEQETLRLRLEILIDIDANLVTFDTIRLVNNDYDEVYYKKYCEQQRRNYIPASEQTIDIEPTPKTFIRNGEQFISDAPANVVDTVKLVHADKNVITAPIKSSAQKKIFIQKIAGTVLQISDVRQLDEGTAKRITICGDIGTGDRNGVKLREFKKGACIVTFAISDDSDGIICKKFFKTKSDGEKFLGEIKSTKRVKLSGTLKHDDFLNEIVIQIEHVEPIPDAPPRTDDAEVKRVELHVHTTMSALDAIISPETLITTAANWGWSAVAITDHGVVQAFPAAADTAAKLAKQGKHIKIIYGMEGYLMTDENQKYSYHVILLAKNKKGLDNLYRLVSISELKYFYRKPRIPKELLAKFRDGLIIGSACAQGELIDAIINCKSDAELEEIASFYDYLEIQPIHNNDYLKRRDESANIKFDDKLKARLKIETDEDLRDINRRVVALAEKLGKPLVATCDAHFLNEDDAIYREIMMFGKTMKGFDKQPPIFLRTTDEMLSEFTYLGKDLAYKAVIENPNKIADSIEDLKPIPDGLYSPQMPGADEEITKLSYNKAISMYGDPLPKIVRDRLEQELKPITAHGFSALYLIAQKLVKKSNDDGYLVGSRGSVGSSFVAAMTGITEVNPLPPHYRCPKCMYSEFFTHGEYSCGYDLPDKNCPVCGHPLIKDGHDIPFAVFLGFDGDKVPDIDLNFSGEYQAAAHKYTEILFGKHNVYRAGTISTVADKTAYAFTKKYYSEYKHDDKHGSFIAKKAEGFTGVKRTSGQHPAGIMVVPRDMDIHYFTPIQHPAEDRNSNTITTHFDYHSISSRLVKLDILGHDDPTVIKMLEKITHIDPLTIPLDDKPTLSLFSSTKAIGLKSSQLGTKSGTFGIPEFRTSFTRTMIDETTPKCFSDLVRISGFSHGTDVWIGNAQDLIKEKKCTLQDAISARDDIMMYLIHQGVDSLKAFKIMEGVRKGKGIKPDDVEMLKAKKIPDWYIDACQKIKYLFPRAHATAYVMMAYRIAYCKVHYPLAYYAAYFSIRADEFDADEIVKGENFIKGEIDKLEDSASKKKLELKENERLAVLQVAYEMYLRGMSVEHVDLYNSDAEKFIVLKNSLLPPLSSLKGVGTVAARKIAKIRKNGKFLSIEDLTRRTGINKTAVEALKNHGSLKGMNETDQISLF